MRISLIERAISKGVELQRNVERIEAEEAAKQKAAQPLLAAASGRLGVPEPEVQRAMLQAARVMKGGGPGRN